jgi:hypothetical protein
VDTASLENWERGYHKAISLQEDAVKRCCAERILGVLSGFDRLVFRGTLRRIAYVEGLAT